ncbi:methylated-DNA--[protein]-cysteine S-methyltransferase [Demequina sp. NBRC 110052]|uniref:methylated-DNA--[protein]-cysteine S-methyltransferase n=1 Tax=Demequina sp. NBRC 110052 TaxID=1570341 RepID=UPI0026F40C20|nr:methylated-DNA--[protein]-cysteine S-methyltransferase [Demequina sp. NBRC 110052]
MQSNGDTRVHGAMTITTPLGAMTLTGTERGLDSAWFNRADMPADQSSGRATDAVASGARALSAYFAGAEDCEPPPLDLQGTEFQRQVWGALLTIPFGETRTYREIAAAVNRPRAIRAVAAAIGANPVGVLVPCHRVIGSDGTLTGYAGGIERKRWLLAHEGAALAL